MFRFHWSPRVTNELNWMSDIVAGMSRLAIADAPLDNTATTRAQQAANAIDNLRPCCPNTGELLDPYRLTPDGA